HRGAEVVEAADELRRAAQVGAAGHRFVGLAVHRCAADGAGPGHLPGRAALGARLEDDADDLRDDVAGAAQEDAVAFAHVLAAHFFLVVQRGARDGDAADVDRLEEGDGRERAGAAGGALEVLAGGRLFFRRELPGDGPARRARDGAQAAALVFAVDLDHAAIDLVGQVVALLDQAGVLGLHRLDRVADLVFRIGAEAELAQPGE